MKNTSVTEKKIKGKVLTAFYYTIFILYSIIAYCHQWLNYSVIYSTSKILFNLIFAMIPIVLLILPFILQNVTNEDFGKCVKKSMILFLACIVLSCGTSAGLNLYFQEFTIDKWDTFKYNRYLMIDDMESKYDFVGMTEDEVEAILGKNYNVSSYNNETTYAYGIREEFLRSKAFLVSFENGVVKETRVINQTSSI